MCEVPLTAGSKREAFGRRASLRGLERTPQPPEREREFFIDNLLVRIHCIIVMIGWTGLAPWESELSFPGSLTSTFLTPYPMTTLHSKDCTEHF